MLPLVLGLLALCIGPVLGPVLLRVRGLAGALDGFVVVAVCGLVVLHILPQSVALGGGIALPLAGFGLLLPAVLHRFDARTTNATARGGRALIGTLGLIAAAFAHALLDGVALTAGGLGHDHHDDQSALPVLAIAVILHRVPYALALWLVGRDKLGLTRTLLVLGALASGTIAGAVAGDQLVTSSSAAALALVQAFAAGAILHVLLDAPPIDVSGAASWSLGGVVVGLAAVVALTLDHPIVAADGELSFSTTLLSLGLGVAPVALAGLVANALVASLRSTLSLRWHRSQGQRLARGPPLLEAAVGVVAGSLRSLCSCTVVRVFEKLLRRRASVVTAIAFLVAAPELSLPGLFLSLELLGAPFTLLRLLAAVALALIVAVAVGRLGRAEAPPADDAGATVWGNPGGSTVVQQLWRSFDHTAPWLVAGVVVAALVEPLLSPTILAQIPRAFEVPLYAVIGVPLYVCGQGSAPIAAVLLHKGASAGAVVALLLTAPATNVATLGVLARLLSRRAAVLFCVLVFLCASAAGVAINGLALHPEVALPPSLGAGGTAPWQLACLGLVLVLVAASVARQGVRRFLGQILHPLDDAKGGHVHGPHCGHAEHRSPGFLKKAPVAKVKIDFAP